jgi:hypothetical protein
MQLTVLVSAPGGKRHCQQHAQWAEHATFIMKVRVYRSVDDLLEAMWVCIHLLKWLPEHGLVCHKNNGKG